MTRLGTLDLNLLVSLQALITHRSVTEAADAVGVTQPAMSHSLARLRRHFDDQLLIRSGGSYVLTQRAKLLADPLRDALILIDNEVLGSPEFDPATSHRIFTIAASNASGSVVLAQVVPQLVERSPSIELRLLPTHGGTELLLTRTRADLVLLPDILHTDYPRERLYEDTWVCVADRDNAAIGEELTSDVLRRLPRLAFESLGTRVYPEQAIGAQVPVRPASITVSDFLTIPFLIRGTQLVAFLQRRVAESFADMPWLRILEPPIPLPSIRIDMVWNPLTEREPAVTWLRETLLDAMAGD